jgi:predicted HicB family RNase H-like nuclease
MSNTMTYQGYAARMEYDDDDCARRSESEPFAG